MVIFIVRNYACFSSKCLKVFVSRGKGKCAYVAFIQWDGSNELALPGKHNVVMLGDARVAVIMLLLLGHGLLHPMLQ